MGDLLWAALRLRGHRRHKVKVKRIKMSPHDVFFINPTIIDRFSCGRTVASTIEDLTSGRTDVSEIPAIRVVQRCGKTLTLDHRRLYAFRAALPPATQVRMNLLLSDVVADKFVLPNFTCHNAVH